MNEPLAFSNPEYMCFSEIKNIIQQQSAQQSNTTRPTQRRKAHRPVPLPPPARPPPPPPSTLPPALPPKLYQNLPVLSEQIHIECYNPRSTTGQFINTNLLKIQDSSNTTYQDSTCGSSMIILSSNNTHQFYNNSNTASDSSTATMIVKSSPEERKPSRKSIISPIMTSSRADLHKQQFSYPIDIDSTPFQLNPGNNHHITHSLPFKRVGNHQRQRKLSFNETMEIIEQHTKLPETTLAQKSFSNFNYELQMKSHESLTASSDSLSASSSLSSLVLQPPSPFKTSIIEPSKQTPSKSNIKSSTLQRKQIKKVSFMLREEAVLNTSDYDCTENLIQCQSMSPNSSMSSLDFHSDKIIFANHDYFLNLHNNMEPSSSSSSSASSTCSSSSSTSSGYKSINISSKISPSDLNFFIQSNQDRLERLRQKRAELLMARNTNKLTEILDYEETRNSEHLKDVSAKLFSSPALSTLPRCSVPKKKMTMF